MAIRGFNIGTSMFHKPSIGRSFVKGFNLKKIIQFLHKFTNQTTTIAGERYFVNEGTNGIDALMHFGQGLRTNSIDQGFSVDLVAGSFLYVKDSVLTHEEITTPETRVIDGEHIWQNLINTPSFVFSAPQIESHRQNPENTLYWDNGVLKSDILEQETIGSMQAGNGFWYPMTEQTTAGAYLRNHALPFDVSDVPDFNVFETRSLTVTPLGGSTYEFNSVDLWHVLRFAVSSTARTGYQVVEFEITEYTSGVLRPQLMDFADKNQLLANFVLTINETGVYRLVAYAEDYGYVRFLSVGNHGGFVGKIKILNTYALENSTLTPITNYSDTMRTNAQQLTTGYQTALVELDDFGLPIGKPDGLLYGDGRGYINTNGMLRVDGDFYLDVYIDTNAPDLHTANENYVAGAVYSSDGTNLGNFLIRNYNNGNCNVQFDNKFYTSAMDKGVITVERTGSLTKVWFNDSIVATNSVGGDYVVIDQLMRFSTTTPVTKGMLGTLQALEGARTDEERTADIQKLMTKHGVVA